MKYKSIAINLSTNDYRRQFMEGQEALSGLEINFFPAVTPDKISDIDHAYCPRRAAQFTGRELYPTEIACALSHITLWRQLLLDETFDAYLIMEDDIHIKRDIAALLARCDLNDISFLKLSGQCQRPSKKIVDIDDQTALYQYAFGPLDAACYLVTKDAAQKLIDYCRPLFSPIDIMMDRSYDHGVPIYGIMPYPTETRFCFDQSNPLCSDIGERNSDYKKERTLKIYMLQRWYRITGGIKRKWATYQLKT